MTELKVCVFCGSRAGNDPAYTDAAHAMAHELAKRNMQLVFGGGGTGLMGETARTALKLGTGSVSSFSDASRISNYAKPSVSALVGAKVIGGSKGKINPLSKVTRAEMAVMLYRATHLTVQGSGAVYQSRGDLVNLCIGTQNYCDVVIENYDPSVTYTGLMGYTDFRRVGGVTYVSLSGKRAIDRTVTYTNGVFTFADGEGTVSIPAAAGQEIPS